VTAGQAAGAAAFNRVISAARCAFFSPLPVLSPANQVLADETLLERLLVRNTIFISCASCFDNKNTPHRSEKLILSPIKTRMMESLKDSPKVYIPPPLLYVATFLLAVLIQKLLPLGIDFFRSTTSKIIGSVIILVGLFFIFPALRQFFKTKNTLVTIKPANSLETTGIFTVSRNPMYISLMLFYIGLSFIIGNWWNFILLPFLYILIQEYVIKREERYLDRRFGQQYLDYKSKVRRWL
jgi:protein-S-isoprenylcysteine O-methyltransferase Ste14